MTKQFALFALGVALTMPLSAQAESKNYQCTYTQATYTAPFMKEPSTRNCPESKCNYMITVSGNSATVNGVSGFSVLDSDTQLILERTAKDPIMGGMDTTRFEIDKSAMQFKATKTTTPSVTLTTMGSCS